MTSDHYIKSYLGADLVSNYDPDDYIKSYLGADTANYRDRYVAFVDILGFRDLIARIESPDDALFQRLYRILVTIRQPKLWDVQVSCFSDCIVVSSTPDRYFAIILRVRNLYDALLFHGILCRGAVMIGPLCHQNDVVFGPGLVSAYEQESSLAVYPRILVPADFYEDFKCHSNPRASKIFMKDNAGLYFVNPFSPHPGGAGMVGFFGPVATDNESTWESRYFTTVRGHIETGLLDFRTEPQVLVKYDWLARQFNGAVSSWDIAIPPIPISR